MWLLPTEPATPQPWRSGRNTRYGNGVLPMAFEIGGRLGDEGIAGLERLAAAAAAVPQVATKRGLVARWRRRLEMSLQFACADAVLLALTGTSEEVPEGAAPPRPAGPTPAQLARATANRQAALAIRQAREIAAEHFAGEEEAARELHGEPDSWEDELAVAVVAGDGGGV